MFKFATKATEAVKPVRINLSRRNTCNHGTSGLYLVLTIAKSAMDRERGNFGEGLCDRRVASPELHLAKSRCVDQEHTRGQPDQVPVSCSVPSFAVFVAHAPGLPRVISAEHIDQGGFTHSRRTE